MQGCNFRTLLWMASALVLIPSVARAAATISLTVDATKSPEKLLHSHEVIPVMPGPVISASLPSLRRAAANAVSPTTGWWAVVGVGHRQ